GTGCSGRNSMQSRTQDFFGGLPIAGSRSRARESREIPVAARDGVRTASRKTPGRRKTHSTLGGEHRGEVCGWHTNLPLALLYCDGRSAGEKDSCEREVGLGIQRRILVLAGKEARIGGGSDHRCIVGRKRATGEKHIEASALTFVLE